MRIEVDGQREQLGIRRGKEVNSIRYYAAMHLQLRADDVRI